MSEPIPAYQAIDLILGLQLRVDIQPIIGWVVQEPGYYDRPQVFPHDRAVTFTDSPDDATELFCYAKARSKYPEKVFVRPCWIHSGQSVRGSYTNRRFWTPR